MAGRETLRSRWIKAVTGAEIGNATKALLLYFATRMTATGYVDPMTRDDLADLFHVHPQRIAERIHEARQAGLLAQVDGSGVRGRRARYIATLPPGRVPLSGTDKGRFVTGERYPQIGTLTGRLGTAERYPQHARAIRKASRVRSGVVHDVRASRNHGLTAVGSDEGAGSNSAVAAVLRKFNGRRPTCTGLRRPEAVAA